MKKLGPSEAAAMVAQLEADLSELAAERASLNHDVGAEYLSGSVSPQLQKRVEALGRKIERTTSELAAMKDRYSESLREEHLAVLRKRRREAVRMLRQGEKALPMLRDLNRMKDLTGYGSDIEHALETLTDRIKKSMAYAEKMVNTPLDDKATKPQRTKLK